MEKNLELAQQPRPAPALGRRARLSARRETRLAERATASERRGHADPAYAIRR
jgi:hypothetical protein